MDIKIRNERISNFNSVANVNYEAFLGWHPDNQYVSEPILVDLLRHNSMFDPELSLVAEFDGKVVGHVLFSPFNNVSNFKIFDEQTAHKAFMIWKDRLQEDIFLRKLVERCLIIIKAFGIIVK